MFIVRLACGLLLSPLPRVHLCNSWCGILGGSDALWYLSNKTWEATPVVTRSWTAGTSKGVFRLANNEFVKAWIPGVDLACWAFQEQGERPVPHPTPLENLGISLLKSFIFIRPFLLFCSHPWCQFWLFKGATVWLFTKWTRRLNILAISDPLLFAKFLATWV